LATDPGNPPDDPALALATGNLKAAKGGTVTFGHPSGTFSLTAEPVLVAHPNEDLAREGFAAFARGDMDAVGQFLGEDTRWHFPGRNPLSGDYEGVAEVLGVFGKVFELSGAHFNLSCTTSLPTMSTS
jgi:hypothetical protein